jgi:hypothetical protein
MKSQILKIFDYNIIFHEVPKEIYSKKSLKNSIDDLFNSDIVLTYGSQSPEQVGKAYSTCSLDDTLIFNLEDISSLLDYVADIILKTFYFDYALKEKIVYTRIWANKIYENCSGECHIHDGNNDGTAIFYYDVPENSSELIILKESICGLVDNSHKNISHYIKVKTGDLIIHEKHVPHAVSKHLNVRPRICFIFDFCLAKNYLKYSNEM